MTLSGLPYLWLLLLFSLAVHEVQEPTDHDEISPFSPLARGRRIALLKQYLFHSAGVKFLGCMKLNKALKTSKERFAYGINIVLNIKCL